jgi:hypothetical protein
MFLRYLSSAIVLTCLSAMAVAQSEPCNSIEVPVGIINGSGESFHGLSAADFSVHAGKTPVELKNMTFDSGPRRIVLVVDTSKRLSSETLKAERLLVETLVNGARPEDSLAMVTARGPQHVVKFGEEKSAFQAALPADGESRHGKEQGVLDAVMQTLPLFGDPKPGDSIVVIAADLGGNRGTNAKEVASALEQHHIRMFGLALGLVSTKNVALSDQTTTAWGLAQVQNAMGDYSYNTGDSDFYPLTRDSGGLVLSVMNYSSRMTFSVKNPKFVARLKQQSMAVYNVIAGYYRVELATTHTGEWSFEPQPDVRKVAPNMFLLYPRQLTGCKADAHVAAR